MKDDQIKILLQGSELKESWNSFNFRIMATDLNSNISNNSYLFTVNTQPDCLDVKFSLPSLFSNTISYTIGIENKKILFQAIDSKSTFLNVPYVCGPIIMQFNQTDIYAAKSTSLPDFIQFDQTNQSLIIEASKAKVGTFYLLLDVFFDYFKEMP